MNAYSSKPIKLHDNMIHCLELLSIHLIFLIYSLCWHCDCSFSYRGCPNCLIKEFKEIASDKIFAAIPNFVHIFYIVSNRYNSNFGPMFANFAMNSI